MLKSHLFWEGLLAPSAWGGASSGPQASPWLARPWAIVISRFLVSPCPTLSNCCGKLGRACHHAQLLGFNAVVLGPPREAILGNVLWAPQVERKSPAGPTPQRWACRYLRIFKGMEVSLMATITPPWSRYRMWCSSSNTCREVDGTLRRVGHCSGLGVARWGQNCQHASWGIGRGQLPKSGMV